MVQSLRRNCRTRDKLLDELRTFQLSSLKCSNASDRDFILPAIERWYGSREVFEFFVRTTLYEELKPLQGMPRTGQQLLILTSPLAVSAEHMLSVIKSSEPTNRVVSRLLAVHVGVHVFVCLLLLRFLFNATAKFAAPRRSRLLDWGFSALLTLSVGVIYTGSFWLAFVSVELGLGPSVFFCISAGFCLLIACACCRRR